MSKQIPWNKGLTKETDERVASVGEKLKGKPTWNNGKHLTDNHKEKISKANQNKIPWNKGLKAKDNEGIKRSCEAAHEACRGKEPWNKNISWSSEMKEKLSISHKNQHSSPNTEFKKGNIPFNRGKSPSDKTKEKISNSIIAKNIKSENHPMYGKHHSEVSKEKTE